MDTVCALCHDAGSIYSSPSVKQFGKKWQPLVSYDGSQPERQREGRKLQEGRTKAQIMPCSWGTARGGGQRGGEPRWPETSFGKQHSLLVHLPLISVMYKDTISQKWPCLPIRSHCLSYLGRMWQELLPSGREITQRVKFLLCKNEDLNLDPQPEARLGGMYLRSQCWRGVGGRWQRSHGLPSLLV